MLASTILHGICVGSATEVMGRIWGEMGGGGKEKTRY